MGRVPWQESSWMLHDAPKFRLRPRIRLGTVYVFSQLQSVGKDLMEPARVLQLDANEDEQRRHTVPYRPVELREVQA